MIKSYRDMSSHESSTTVAAVITCALHAGSERLDRIFFHAIHSDPAFLADIEPITDLSIGSGHP